MTNIGAIPLRGYPERALPDLCFPKIYTAPAPGGFTDGIYFMIELGGGLIYLKKC